MNWFNFECLWRNEEKPLQDCKEKKSRIENNKVEYIEHLICSRCFISEGRTRGKTPRETRLFPLEIVEIDSAFVLTLRLLPRVVDRLKNNYARKIRNKTEQRGLTEGAYDVKS